MELTGHVERLRDEVERTAEAIGDDATALAARLVSSLDAASRLVLLEALSEAADEITRELAPGSVEVRLRGREPAFVVTPPPAEEPIADGAAPAAAAPPVVEPEDGATTRINLRLPDGLKARAEEAAARERLSLNAWLVRAAAAALAPAPASAPLDAPGHRTPRTQQAFRGWVR